MRIENVEPGTKAFFEEMFSVSMQYRKLLKKPQRRLKDIPQAFLSGSVGMFVLCAVEILFGLLFDFDGTYITTVCAVTAALAVVELVCYRSVQKQARAIWAQSGPSVFIIDEEGVGTEKEGTMAVKLSWDSIAFARVFSQSVAFIPKEGNGIIVTVGCRYLSEIRGEIRTLLIE